MKTSTTEMPELVTQPVGHKFLMRAFALGTNYFHVTLVAEALKFVLPIPPECSLDEEEAKAIRARGNQLIWYPAVSTDGVPITGKRLYTDLENKAPLGGKILFSPDWYDLEPFFTTETARVDESGLGSWREVGTEAIPGTEGVNFLTQTIIAAKYVAKVIYGGNPPKYLKDIFDEPAKREQEVASLVESDKWPEASKVLVNMPFNRLFRDTFLEVVMRIIVNQHVNKICPLLSKWSYLNACSRGGRLVAFGFADLSGAHVSYWAPRYEAASLGFFLSRSVTKKNAS